MRKTICAFLLVFVLCSSAFAGDIETPPFDNPDPTPVTVENLEPLSAAQSSDDQTTYGLTEAALTVLNNVLTLF